ncbi:MAG: acylphosphatase [Pirellulaceae bacterium]|jgi:acylphosphatase
MKPVRAQVYFAGRVQGVGFRVNVRQIARNFEVVGYVRNLPDGRVHLVAEGLPGELRRFIADIRQNMGRNIHDAAEEELAASGEFEKFEIRY